MFAILVFTLKLSFPVLDVPALPAPPARDLLAQYDCTERLGLAVEAVRREGLERADAIFEDLLADCEGSPGLARELAGIRVAERRWHEATALARRAVEEDPNDQYACDLLGTTLLIQGEVVEALRAWNRIGKPVISDFGLVGSAMRVSVTDLGVDAQRLLTPDRFRRARRRLDERAARTFARVEKFELQPNADGTMTVEVTIAQPSLVPRGWLNWAAVGGSAAVDREATIVFRSPTGPGEKCDTTWRWWTSRPRLAADCSLPSFTHGFWRLETFWEAETFEWTLGSSATHQPNSSSALLLRDVRAHGGLTSTDWLTSVWRYSIGLGFDAWAGRPAPDHADDLHTLEQLTASIPNHARTLSLSTEIERRSPDDRLTVLAAFSTSFPLTGTPPFQSLTTVVSGKSSSSLRGWQSVANVGVTEVSARAPLSVWPKPAVGSELSPFLRAHPLLDRGVVALNGTTVFGRELLHGTVEARYWKLGRAFLPLGLATFLDFARARNGLGTTSGLVGPSSHPWEADAGAGVRLKLLGSSRLIRLDFGYGLRDRARAVTFGPTF